VAPSARVAAVRYTVAEMSARWVHLSGAVNVRDLGGLPTRAGGTTRFGQVFRSDNLQDLTPDDVAHLVETLGVRDVVDLRTGVEVTNEGPGPLVRDDRVAVHHFSLYPEGGERTDVEADLPAGATAGAVSATTVLPWAQAAGSAAGRPWQPAGIYYRRYLEHRPDSVVAALRTMATSPGATIAHCAAGKDRTGVMSALALAVADVEPEAIVEDYVLTGERLDAILTRLRSTPTYAADLDGHPAGSHRPRAEAMEAFLGYLDDGFGGPLGWLASHGWTDDDTAALRARLLDGR
jgi:protein tyrosine/serine phosphatase